MELSTDLTPTEQPELSTQLDGPTPTDPGQAAHKEPADEPEAKAKPDKAETRMDAIKRAAADLGVKDGDDAKEGEEGVKDKDDKEAAAKEPAPKAKTEDGDDADDKPAAPEKPKAERDAKDYPEAPAKFLPAAKEKWRNTPLAVQQEVARLTREHEGETQKYKDSHERYESVREFDELARQNGGDLRQSLARVHELETMMSQNPIAALNSILMQAGPRKADGQPFSLYDVAMHVAQSGPEGYQQMVRQQAPQQQQQGDPRVEQLQAQLQAMQQEQLAAKIIEPFKAANPRYDELEQDIAFFLQSGKIPASLSAQEKLAAAYDMAERINPSSRVAASDFSERLESQPESRADTFSGTKSVKGAPASGVDVSSRKRGKMSRSEAISQAMTELGL